MPTYLWSAKDNTGRVTGQRVNAPSPEAARAILEGQGFSDLRLQWDDFGNAICATPRQTSGEELDCEEVEFSADEELEFARPKSLFGSLVVSLKAWSWVLLPLLIWNGCNLYRGWRWTALNIIAGVLLVAVVYLFCAFNSATVAYDRLLYAVDAGHWGRVALCVKVLRFLRWFNRFGVPEHELIYREARVLFERSGLQAALEHLRRSNDLPGYPKSVYWSRVAGFYFDAQQFSEGLEAQKQSFELGQKSASELIDRAYHLVHYGKDAGAARGFLAQAEEKEIPELAASYVEMCRGMIASREGRFTEAQQALNAAIEKARAFSALPLMAGHIRLIKAHLCIVTARAGNRAEARALFAQVRRFLEKHHEIHLLEECRSALANPVEHACA